MIVILSTQNTINKCYYKKVHYSEISLRIKRKGHCTEGSLLTLRQHTTNSVLRDAFDKLEYDNSSSLKIRSRKISNSFSYFDIKFVFVEYLCIYNVFKRKCVTLTKNIILLTDLQPGGMRNHKPTKSNQNRMSYCTGFQQEIESAKPKF